jgi:hypothetical protein
MYGINREVGKEILADFPKIEPKIEPDTEPKIEPDL